MTRWRAAALVGLLVLVADQVSKWWALDSLGGGRTLELIWTLQFRLVRNTGVAFSQGQGSGPIIALAVVCVVVLLFRIGAKVGQPVARIAVGAVIGGAVGNLSDRALRSEEGLLRGAVVDFVDFQWWPVFNVADAAIVLGGVVIVWSGLAR
jgi:signal peptidase II